MILSAFIFFGFSAAGQNQAKEILSNNIPDTLYTKAGTIANFKTTVTKTTEINGKKITEVEAMDTLKLKMEVNKLVQDTAQYSQYIKMLDQQSNQIQTEKRRIRLLAREARRQIILFKDLLTRLKL
jgi:tRNA U34 5-carboxymethylaminomethyl modifying enzyme MnmG/GidA